MFAEARPSALDRQPLLPCPLFQNTPLPGVRLGIGAAAGLTDRSGGGSTSIVRARYRRPSLPNCIDQIEV